MRELFNIRRPGFWLLLAALLVIVFLMAEQRLQVPLSNELDEEDYVFAGPTSVLAGEQFLLVESHPQTAQEELVYLDFLYNVNKDFSKLQNILAPIKGLQISLENSKKETDASLYTSYILHQFSTLDPSLINQASAGHRYAYYGLDKLVKECKLVDYQVINVVYTQRHSKALLALGPQWGDGALSRNYLVGKAHDDESYLIYDFGMPLYVTSDAQPDTTLVIAALTHLFFPQGNVRTWYQDSWLDRESATNAPTKRDFALPDHYFNIHESNFALYDWTHADQTLLPDKSAVYLGTDHDNCFVFILGTDLVTHVDDGTGELAGWLTMRRQMQMECKDLLVLH